MFYAQSTSTVISGRNNLNSLKGTRHQVHSPSLITLKKRNKKHSRASVRRPVLSSEHHSEQFSATSVVIRNIFNCTNQETVGLPWSCFLKSLHDLPPEQLQPSTCVKKKERKKELHRRSHYRNYKCDWFGRRLSSMLDGSGLTSVFGLLLVTGPAKSFVRVLNSSRVHYS